MPWTSHPSLNHSLDLSQPPSSANQMEEKVLMISTHSTLSTPEEILAPKSQQAYHSTETPSIHMSLEATTTTSISTNNENSNHTPLFEKHYQNTENGDDATATMTPPDTPSFPSLSAPKPDEGKTTAESHDIIIKTMATTSDFEVDDNHFSTMELIHKKKSIRSRFKDALKIKSNRRLKTIDLENPSPASFSFVPSSSTPAPTLQSPLLDKRHSTSSSLLDHSKITLLQQKHENKAKSWHPPSTSSHNHPSLQHSILPQSLLIENDNLDDLDEPSSPTKIKSSSIVESYSLLSSSPTHLDDSPPVPTSRFLTAFQKFYQQKPNLDTIQSSYSKIRAKEEKHIPPTSTNSSKNTTSLADKIKTRFKSNGTCLKSPVTTSSSRLHSSESSSMAQSWSNFSQSFLPSCSVNYASHRQNRQNCGIAGTRHITTDLKNQKASTMFEQQKYNDPSKGQAFTPSSDHSQHTSNKRLSQQYPLHSSDYSTLKDSPMLTKLGHNKSSRLSIPSSSARHQKEKIHPNSAGNWKTSLDKNMSPSSQRPSITNTTSFSTLSASSSTNKTTHMDINNSNKPSLSLSSSFSTSSTASCSSTSYLSVSSTQSNKKTSELPTSPIPCNSSLPTKNKMTRSPRLDRLEKNRSVIRTKIPLNQSMTLQGDRLKKKKKKLRVRFLAMTTVQDTFSRNDYDRASDPYAVCTRLTASLAQQIKEELNTFKLEEMKIHSLSRCNTQFFL